MKIKVDVGGYVPSRAHDTDAGMDLRTPVAVTVPAHGSVVVNTKTHVELPQGCGGLIVSKSGLNVMHGITSTGLIDEGYTGTILVRLYNHSGEDYSFHEGDKVTQLVVMPVRYEQLEVVDSTAGGDRGDDGFGSTGR
jgi:dUTP pyrophosphatase